MTGEQAKTKHARGTFEVQLAPQPAYNQDGAAQLGRMSIDKTFQGDLEATSRGEMLTGMSGVKGSAGYVAMERVTGSLNGQRGAFTLQHSGTMNRGAPSLVVTVVPDSGTEALEGLTGVFRIIVADGKHSYEMDYALAPAGTS